MAYGAPCGGSERYARSALQVRAARANRTPTQRPLDHTSPRSGGEHGPQRSALSVRTSFESRNIESIERA
eukprot:6641624-Prymnesium_polylepis.1